MRFSLGFTLSLLRLMLLVVSPLAMEPPSASADPAADRAGTAHTEANLDEILRAFREMPGLEASFIEEKKLALLARPLISEGTIYVLPRRALLRVVERPRKGEILIDGSALIMREDGREERMDLRSMHAIRPLVEGLLMLFTGDRAALERVFTLEFEPEGARWELTLKPKDAQLAHLLSSMKIEGQGYGVDRIIIKERSGDETTTRIVSANPRRNFNAKERAKLFGDADS